MSTQHPDNVAVPFFASGPVMGGEDEIREAFYAYSHLGCDEQMWDFEGKEVDEFVVEKLLSSYESFFREHPLGEEVRLTPRVPNPALEKAQGKVLLEVLHSIPRHSDVSRMFYGREREPIVEVIFPMTTSADELLRIREHYRTRIAALDDDPALRSWFGEFKPDDIAIIPLVEDRPSLLAADRIVAEYARISGAREVRVFIARSDPALNYGFLPATLLSMVALARLARLDVPTHPIIGVGGPAFRGSLRPDSLDRVLARYPSVETFTIQSAFKYDHPVDDVIRAIAALRAAPRREPVAFDERRALEIADRVAARYRDEVLEVAPTVRAVSEHVPRRRMRKLHIGLFGYARQANGMSLPRTIPFVASLYGIGLPPEVLGLSALTADDLSWLRTSVPCIDSDLCDAAAYLDPDVAAAVPQVAPSVRAALALDVTAPNAAHLELARETRRRLDSGDVRQLSELVTRQGAIRHFLG
ncbi:MAG: phosphoenolpyruvate carboxylase [Chloroflexi bacterium 13_1_40CM_4_68_4]|nr:MAG: phosphoenolpyruvate carboxylase [Chloroflexi bacterium 13_1_40CM_4_68_4]